MADMARYRKGQFYIYAMFITFVVPSVIGVIWSICESLIFGKSLVLVAVVSIMAMLISIPSLILFARRNNEIVLTKSGIVIDDFTKREIPWKEIVLFEVREFRRQQSLVVKFKAGSKYIKNESRNEFHVCNLSEYKDDADGMFAAIKRAWHEYS